MSRPSANGSKGKPLSMDNDSTHVLSRVSSQVSESSVVIGKRKSTNSRNEQSGYSSQNDILAFTSFLEALPTIITNAEASFAEKRHVLDVAVQTAEGVVKLAQEKLDVAVQERQLLDAKENDFYELVDRFQLRHLINVEAPRTNGYRKNGTSTSTVTTTTTTIAEPNEQVEQQEIATMDDDTQVLPDASTTANSVIPVSTTLSSSYEVLSLPSPPVRYMDNNPNGDGSVDATRIFVRCVRDSVPVICFDLNDSPFTNNMDSNRPSSGSTNQPSGWMRMNVDDDSIAMDYSLVSFEMLHRCSLDYSLYHKDIDCSSKSTDVQKLLAEVTAMVCFGCVKHYMNLKDEDGVKRLVTRFLFATKPTNGNFKVFGIDSDFTKSKNESDESASSTTDTDGNPNTDTISSTVVLAMLKAAASCYSKTLYDSLDKKFRLTDNIIHPINPNNRSNMLVRTNDTKTSPHDDIRSVEFTPLALWFMKDTDNNFVGVVSKKESRNRRLGLGFWTMVNDNVEDLHEFMYVPKSERPVLTEATNIDTDENSDQTVKRPRLSYDGTDSSSVTLSSTVGATTTTCTSSSSPSLLSSVMVMDTSSSTFPSPKFAKTVSSSTVDTPLLHLGATSILGTAAKDTEMDREDVVLVSSTTRAEAMDDNKVELMEHEEDITSTRTAATSAATTLSNSAVSFNTPIDSRPKKFENINIYGELFTPKTTSNTAFTPGRNGF